MATVRHLGLFPWCIPRDEPEVNAPPLPPPQDGTWFFGLTQNELMLLYWRIKKLRLYTANPALYVDGLVCPWAESEKDLVCTDYWDTQLFSYWQIDNYPEPPDDDEAPSPTGLFHGAEFSITFPWTFYSTENNLYYLYCYGIWSSSDSRDPDPNNWVSGAAQTNYVAVESGSFGGNATLLGKNWAAGHDSENTFFEAGSIVPIEYWPYDPGDGLGPIYNSATGAQLRPFPA